MILPHLGDGHDQACQGSDHLGGTQTGQLLEQGLFIPRSLCPGLEIIGLQSEIRRKENSQKSDRFEQDKLLDWTTVLYPHPGAIKCPQLDVERYHVGGGAQWEIQGHRA